MPPKGLTSPLQALEPSTPLLRPGDALPAAAGAYGLMIRIDRPAEIKRRGRSWRIPAGWHVYAGSAYGPGGVAARLGRHFREDKPLRWHVDALTTQADALAAFAYEGGAECALVAGLLAQPGFSAPAPGFGSSDCRVCPAHLLSWLG